MDTVNVLVAQLPRFLWHTFIKHKQSALYDRQKHSAEVGRYVSFTPMWERTICGFREGRRGPRAQRACFVGI